jgi:hypothetical protein
LIIHSNSILQAIDEKIRELSKCHIVYARIDFKKVNFLSWPLALYNDVVNFSSEPLFHISVNHCFFFIGVLYRYRALGTNKVIVNFIESLFLLNHLLMLHKIQRNHTMVLLIFHLNLYFIYLEIIAFFMDVLYRY